MLQVIQYQKTGDISVADLPAPMAGSGTVLVRNAFSVISAGTERTSVETAQASMLGKARSRPDLVRQVVENMKREGLVATYQKVQNRLDNYKELGYSSAGVVVESQVEGFAAGDRVACAGTAYHAEYVCVPKHLARKVPDGVALEDAAFCTLGAIALQGVRQSQARLGETVVVIGLGLLGLLAVQLAKASGCRVIGLDIADTNFALAHSLGCDDCILTNGDAERAIAAFTRGYGADAVIITASTHSNDPLELAVRCTRKKGRVVVVGSVGMDVPRSPFYEKELDITISCSYGPGRYDAQYEQAGVDYPVGYVRWTENRNMEAVLDMMAAGKLAVRPLVTHVLAVQEALQAYDLITGVRKERYLGILLKYPADGHGSVPPVRKVQTEGVRLVADGPRIGLIGGGNFAQSYLLPSLRSLGAQFACVATSKPITAVSVGKKFGFAHSATDADEILCDKSINAVVIATRHDTHARYVIKALEQGKHVFVEKPLAITREELQAVREAKVAAGSQYLMVGFNRRFSAPIRDIKAFFGGRHEPMVMLYRVHAGALPATHWTQDPGQGGRIIGEACHFVDTMVYLTGAIPTGVTALSAMSDFDTAHPPDTVGVLLRFSDGSAGTLLYLANGDSSVPKEYCEVYAGGKTAIMDNFKEVRLHTGGVSVRRRYKGGKGHHEEMEHFLQVLRGEKDPETTFTEVDAVTATTFGIHDALRNGGLVAL